MSIEIKEIHNPRIAVISFVTNSSHLNYGATLHGYAFQKYLKQKYNVDCIIIDYIPKALSKDNLKYPILNPWGGGGVLRSIIRKLNWIFCFKANIRKWHKFKRFIKRELIVTNKVYTYDSLMSESSVNELSFNIYVCEADVIWKVFGYDDFDENFFLAFPAARNKIKVAYAPTISSKPMEDGILEQFKNMTKDFNGISAREGRGSKYLSQILNKEVIHVLDPTLLLDESDYKKIIIEPKEKDDYLLIYTCTVNDINMVKAAVAEGKRRKLKIIEISNYGINRFVINHKVKTDIGIEEWLGYIKNAKLICTNSFHGICFSVIFQKNFFVFERDKRDFRMLDIVQNLGIEDRLIPAGDYLIPKNCQLINYKQVYENLNVMRKQSDTFILRNIIDNLTPDTF